MIYKNFEKLMFVKYVYCTKIKKLKNSLIYFIKIILKNLKLQF